MMRNQKGITLIALVITIIVLLILAGVSIAMLTGENGILKKATTAGSETKISQQKEQVILAINEVTSDFYDKKYVQNDESVSSQTVGDYVVANISGKVTEYVTVDTATTGQVTFTTKAVDKDGKAQTATYNASTGKISDWTPVTPTSGD